MCQKIKKIRSKGTTAVGVAGMKKIVLIIPSIHVFDYWKKYIENFRKYDHDLERIKALVIDEEPNKVRAKNKELFSDVDTEFWGKKEREQYFQDRFGQQWEKYEKLIPRRAHSETSFGLILAYEEEPNCVIMIDDDTYPSMDYDYLSIHEQVIENSISVKNAIGSKNKWYNVLTNLELEMEGLYPRGYPYDQDARENFSYYEERIDGKIVLNQGLWINDPDLDAVTILAQGGLNGKPRSKSIRLKDQNTVLAKNVYLTVCTMNLAFSPEVIPAFYQLPMGPEEKIDRFDDIWSGLFLKKVCDH
ncbi:MAG: hypothetical protein ACFFCD_15925, partial [Promethearchaeota archaeon]